MGDEKEVTVDDLARQDILPDEVIDKHFLGGPGDDTDDDPAPDQDADDPPEDDNVDDHDDDDADDDGDTDDDRDDDADEDKDVDDGDTDDDDGDDDELDEDADDDDADDGDEDTEDVLDVVTAEDHERIKKDPSLRKVHAQMQKAFTDKTMELAALRANVERRDSRITEFQDAIRTEDGMSRFIAATLTSNPDLIGVAFEALVTSKDANPEAFLIDVGLQSPEIFEAAWDRVQELQADDGELTAHKRDRARQTKESDLDARELRIRQENFDRDMDRVEDVASKEAKRLRIHPDDMEEVNDRVKAKVRDNINRDEGSINLSKADVRAIVADAKKSTDKALDRARARLEREGEVTRRKKDRKKLPKGRRPKRKKSGGPPDKPERKVTFKAPDKGDPLDAFVDHRMEATRS